MKLIQTSTEPGSPAVPSRAYAAQIGTWVKIQTVLNGTEALREAERAYLPQHAEETDDAYEERKDRATLFNMTELTLDSWAGRPFSDPLKANEENPVPDNIQELTDNMDLMGNDIDVFARNWFKDGMAKALSHVLVEFPRTDAPEGRARTLADDRSENLRPYWVHVRPEHVFFADAEVIDGREVLREIRMFEIARIRDQFAEVEKSRIRRLILNDEVDPETNEPTGERNVIVQIYEFVEDAKKEEDKWRLIDTSIMDIDVIPLVTFYSDRTGFMEGKPPVEDLCDLNIAHWQSTSDQRVAVTVARFPILALSGGVDEDQQLRIGPHEWLWSPDPQGKFYYVEHTGKALEAGRKDIEDLERQMSEYGAEFLKKKPGNPTATARALDSAESTSPLQDVAFRFQDALTQALAITAKWLGSEDGDGGEMELVTDFGPEEFTGQDFTALNGARGKGDLSLETYLNELKRRGVLDEDLDIDEEMAKVEQEAMELMQREAEMNLDPGGPPGGGSGGPPGRQES